MDILIKLLFHFLTETAENINLLFIYAPTRADFLHLSSFFLIHLTHAQYQPRVMLCQLREPTDLHLPSIFLPVQKKKSLQNKDINLSSVLAGKALVTGNDEHFCQTHDPGTS